MIVMDAKRVVRTVEQIFILFFLSFFHIVLYYMLCSFCFARAVVIVCVRVDWRATVNALFLLSFASANDEHATDILHAVQQRCCRLSTPSNAEPMRA